MKRLRGNHLLVPWPRRAWVVASVCLLVVGAMGLAFHNKNHGTAFDDSVDHWFRTHGQSLWKTLLHVSDPVIVAVLFVIVIVCAAWHRRWNVVVLAVVTPLVTVESVEYVLKPLVHRTPYVAPGNIAIVKAIFGGHIPTAFPSGHESGIGSFLAVAGLLVLRSSWTRIRKTAALAAIAATALIASMSLVGRYYHYATDTIGSMFYCVAVVLIVGIGVDAASSRSRRHLVSD